jgi:hypothetical protein
LDFFSLQVSSLQRNFHHQWKTKHAGNDAALAESHHEIGQVPANAPKCLRTRSQEIHPDPLGLPVSFQQGVRAIQVRATTIIILKGPVGSSYSHGGSRHRMLETQLDLLNFCGRTAGFFVIGNNQNFDFRP